MSQAELEKRPEQMKTTWIQLPVPESKCNRKLEASKAHKKAVERKEASEVAEGWGEMVMAGEATEGWAKAGGEGCAGKAKMVLKYDVEEPMGLRFDDTNEVKYRSYKSVILWRISYPTSHVLYLIETIHVLY